MSNKAINFELYIKAAQCVIEGDDIFRKKGKNVKIITFMFGTI